MRVPTTARIALALALIAPARAHAHGHLTSAAPAAGARLSAPPRELRLTFSEAPALAFTRVVLLGAAGDTIALEPLAAPADAPRAVVAAVRGALTAGTYTIAWQMAGDDGHVTRGRFAFTIVTPAARAAAPGGGDSAPRAVAPSPPASGASGTESPLYAAVRWLQLVGLVAVIGAAAFALAVVPSLGMSAVAAPARAGAARLALAATGVVAVGAVLRLLAQSSAMGGATRAMLTDTVWGRGWLLEVAGVVVAAIGFSLAARARRGAWAVATIGALALAVTPALSGHAAAAPRLRALAILADALHVVGAGGWLGNLLCVAVVGVPAAMRLAPGDRDRAVADLVNAFSPTALLFASIVGGTGVFAAWLHLGRLDALWRSAYGQTLLVKLAVLAAVALAGAYNWLRVRPSLGDDAGASRQRRSAAVELALAAVVLGVTAVLVATPTPMDDAAPTAVPAVDHQTGAGS